MRWPRRRWAVTQYYYGVAARVESRHWTENAATRAAARRNTRISPSLKQHGSVEYRVGRREGR